ncbi:MAG TPA: sulfur transferase domain-containing protein [Thermoanaerobaculia bacterium]|nr:sulfur transferase domain-containing protein [Thermoanaerobaculia bacterium]
MRRFALPAFSLALAAVSSFVAVAAGIPETLKPEEALNYRKAGSGLATAGKPSPETLAKLREMGFRTAIDLRQPAEGVEAARKAVEEQGLTFVSVPVSPETFRADDAKKVAAVLDDPKAGPILLYCSSSNRVGGVLAVVEGLRGTPHDEALAEGRKAGLKSAAMIDAVERVLSGK